MEEALSDQSCGSKGFDKEYWDINYCEPEEMDGIGNVKEHIGYIKNIFSIEMIEINSIIDFGFGLGHMFEEAIKAIAPYRALGVEPSKYAYESVRLKKLNEIYSSKVKIEKKDLITWCEMNENAKRFDLGFCTSVFQYLSEEEIDQVLPMLAQRCRYLYFSVPTDKEFKRQISDLEFHDKYATHRSRSWYLKKIKPHFTIVSARILESRICFDESNTPFTDLLFRF